MSKIMRFSLYKSNVKKYISGILLACLVIPICSGQPPQKNNVNDFNTASWNSNGGRWVATAQRPASGFINVQMLMNYGVDVLAIQEAGSLTRARLPLTSPNTPMNVCFLGGERGELEFPDFNPGVTEHIWNTGPQSAYIYYYDRNIADDDLDPNVASRPPRETSKQNLAIVSRHRANEVVIFEHIITNDARLNVNRPILGIRINNTFFFNVHPEPNDINNEATLMINAIQSYMSDRHPTRTWMVMGDFNRIPQDVINDPNILQPPAGFFRNIVTTGQSTRLARELDYAFVGGLRNNFIVNNMLAFHAAQLFLPILQQLNRNLNNPSDHAPIIFKRP